MFNVNVKNFEFAGGAEPPNPLLEPRMQCIKYIGRNEFLFSKELSAYLKPIVNHRLEKMIGLQVLLTYTNRTSADKVNIFNV